MVQKRKAASGVDESRAQHFARSNTDAQGRAVNSSRHEEWVGPWNTARDLHEGRDAAKVARDEELLTKTNEQLEEEDYQLWQPVLPLRTLVRTDENAIRPLKEITASFITDNIDCLESFGGVDDSTKNVIAHQLCAMRGLNAKALQLFLPDARVLNIPDCSLLTEFDIVAAIQCTGNELRELKLGYCGRCFSDNVVHDIGNRLQELKVLHLGECYRITDAGMTAIVQNMPNLTSIMISSNQKLSKSAIDAICSLPNLTELHIQECPQLVDDDLASLLQLRQLRQLRLIHLDGISESFMIQLAPQLSNLVHLSLANCAQFTNVVIEALLQHTLQLTSVDFSTLPSISDDCLSAFQKHKIPIESLDLRGCVGLTDTGIMLAVSNASRLKSVNIGGIPSISNKTLAALSSNCPLLEDLNVSFCRNITNGGLGSLTSKCTQLEKLCLWGCTQISTRFLLGHGCINLRIKGHPLLTGLQIRY